LYPGSLQVPSRCASGGCDSSCPTEERRDLAIQSTYHSDHLISPAGFEKYFAELADLFQGDGPPDAEKLAQLANRYEITADMTWIPELTAKYNQKLLG